MSVWQPKKGRGDREAIKRYRDICLCNRYPEQDQSLLPNEEDLIWEYVYILPYDDVAWAAAILGAPLRRQLKIGHFPIDTNDTKILCSNILGQHDLIKAIHWNKGLLWGKVFRTKSKAFLPRKGYHFAGRVSTDCTSVTVYFELNEYDANGRPTKFETTKRKRARMPKAEDEAGKASELYFENNIAAISDKSNCVVADPNKRDLLYSLDSKGNKLRYTSMQRRSETRTKKYTQIVEQKRVQSGVAAWQSSYGLTRLCASTTSRRTWKRGTP
ncbi:hypothetical protein DFS34DRAFT_592820 [Phlyctochytrium arcticum]|nr:hypothetical protein DFS34DRAFT_592820 [Phlyctochytrium arcticum]